MCLVIAFHVSFVSSVPNVSFVSSVPRVFCFERSMCLVSSVPNALRMGALLDVHLVRCDVETADKGTKEEHNSGQGNRTEDRAIPPFSMYTHARTHTHTKRHTHTQRDTHTRAHTRTHTHAHTHTHTRREIRTHKETRTHTHTKRHTHAHTHAHTQ